MGISLIHPCTFDGHLRALVRGHHMSCLFIHWSVSFQWLRPVVIVDMHSVGSLPSTLVRCQCVLPCFACSFECLISMAKTNSYRRHPFDGGHQWAPVWGHPILSYLFRFDGHRWSRHPPCLELGPSNESASSLCHEHTPNVLSLYVRHSLFVGHRTSIRCPTHKNISPSSSYSYKFLHLDDPIISVPALSNIKVLFW